MKKTSYKSLEVPGIGVITMCKTLKRWWYWWKLSRKTKKFFKEEIMLARHKGPMQFSESTRTEVIENWAKAGYDITTPNFGGGSFETRI